MYRMSKGLLAPRGGRVSYWTDRELPDTKDKKEILQDFKAFCEWCWGMGFGNCDECKEKLDDVLKNVTGESFLFKTGR